MLRSYVIRLCSQKDEEIKKLNATIRQLQQVICSTGCICISATHFAPHCIIASPAFNQLLHVSPPLHVRVGCNSLCEFAQALELEKGDVRQLRSLCASLESDLVSSLDYATASQVMVMVMVMVIVMVMVMVVVMVMVMVMVVVVAMALVCFSARCPSSLLQLQALRQRLQGAMALQQQQQQQQPHLRSTLLAAISGSTAISNSSSNQENVPINVRFL